MYHFLRLYSSQPNCLLDLGILGTFIVNEKKVIQLPCRNKGDLMNKKTTIKSLMERRNKPDEAEEADKKRRLNNIEGLNKNNIFEVDLNHSLQSSSTEQ